jgi:L-asparagine transporter-like permease
MRAIFSKIKAKNAVIAVATASIFNAEIWKKSRISLSSLSRQSTNPLFKAIFHQSTE